MCPISQAINHIFLSILSKRTPKRGLIPLNQNSAIIPISGIIAEFTLMLASKTPIDTGLVSINGQIDKHLINRRLKIDKRRVVPEPV